MIFGKGITSLEGMLSLTAHYHKVFMKDLKSKEHYMLRALELAQSAAGRTSPNPLVGAVIVRNGKVVGEGHHKKAGLPHAEIEALAKAGKQARGARMYVNLEPCCHFGRTPPCTDAIIESGIKEVVVGMRDPNKLVGGKGIRILRKAGIKVEVGVLQAECALMNEVFVKYVRTGLPFVVWKTAISLDGKIATASGKSRWITGPKARQCVHALRDTVDAILVGAGTVVKDDPLLTTRLKNKKGKNPARVILDNKCRVSLDARVFWNSETQKVIYVTGGNVPADREKQLRIMGVDLWVVEENEDGLDLTQVMRKLGDQGLTSVLIEGGGEVNASALKSRIVDKVMFFVAPIIIGGRNTPGAVAGKGIENLDEALKVKKLTVRQIGPDFLLEGYL